MNAQIKALATALEATTSIGRNQFREIYNSTVTDPELLSVCKGLATLKTNWGTVNLIDSIYTQCLDKILVDENYRKVVEGIFGAIAAKPVHNTFEFCSKYITCNVLKVKLLESRSIGSKKLRHALLEHWVEEACQS